MVLQAKGLEYKVFEIRPGIGQIAIFRLSGQRKLPVLIENENVIHDSSKIIRYLEGRYPEPHLIPTEIQLATQVHLIEDWADTTLAKSVQKCISVSSITMKSGVPSALKSPPRICLSVIQSSVPIECSITNA